MADNTQLIIYAVLGVIALCAIAFLPRLLGIVYIPHTQIGVVEKLWSTKGSLREGQIIARRGEAGFQTGLLRGGVHFALSSGQSRAHTPPLAPAAQAKIGYVYPRDGEPLLPMQTLGTNIE